MKFYHNATKIIKRLFRQFLNTSDVKYHLEGVGTSVLNRFFFEFSTLLEVIVYKVAGINYSRAKGQKFQFSVKA